MKTLEEIKEEVALMNGYEDWNEMIFASRHPNLLDDIYNAISKHYAKEVAKQALKNASENAVMKVHDGHFKTDSPSKHVQIGANNVRVYKESILNEKNIPEI